MSIYQKVNQTKIVKTLFCIHFPEGCLSLTKKSNFAFFANHLVRLTNHLSLGWQIICYLVNKSSDNGGGNARVLIGTLPTRWSSFASRPRTTASHGRCSMRWSQTPSAIYKLLISLIGSSILFQVSDTRHEIPIYCQCYIFHISDPKFTVYYIMYENNVTCDKIRNFHDCKYVNQVLALCA